MYQGSKVCGSSIASREITTRRGNCVARIMDNRGTTIARKQKYTGNPRSANTVRCQSHSKGAESMTPYLIKLSVELIGHIIVGPLKGNHLPLSFLADNDLRKLVPVNRLESPLSSCLEAHRSDSVAETGKASVGGQEDLRNFDNPRYSTTVHLLNASVSEMYLTIINKGT